MRIFNRFIYIYYVIFNDSEKEIYTIKMLVVLSSEKTETESPEADEITSTTKMLFFSFISILFCRFYKIIYIFVTLNS